MFSIEEHLSIPHRFKSVVFVWGHFGVGLAWVMEEEAEGLI